MFNRLIQSFNDSSHEELIFILCLQLNPKFIAMKKVLLFVLAIGAISCSKEELDLNESQFKELNAVVESFGCAGPDNLKTVTPEYVDENLYTAARIERFYLSLLQDGVSQNGTFNPSISELASSYLEDPLGDFITTYSINEGECQDSVVLTLTVAEPVDDICEADAGSDNSRVVTPEFVTQELYTDARIKRFFIDLLDDGVVETGSFNPTIAEIKTAYLENGLGSYTTTYTVGEATCQDSAELTIVVEEACNVNAGSDHLITVTPQYVQEELFTDARIERFFLDMLDEEVNEDGQFNPSIADIKDQYLTNGPGSYTTVYTIGEGNCQDSAELTINIEESCNLDAGSDKYVTVTKDYVQRNLYTAARIKRFYLNLLDPGVSKNGTFDPTISEIASAYLQNPIGEFTTTYTITDLNGCKDNVVLTINVIE